MASKEQVANCIRALSIDIVNKANSGHPGAPMGMAPVSAVLFGQYLKFDPANPKWINRDRFVLSNGHASALIYSMLHLCGYNLSMEDLKQFRQLHSKTPGHPENYMTEGVEVTTGPLGQGIANAVGIAIAELHLRATFNRAEFPIIDHYTYIFCGDGCLMEGVAREAISLAGHLKLNKMVLIYDDNTITIEGSTNITFTEDTAKEFVALGWNVVTVADGNTDYNGIAGAIKAAAASSNKPTLVILKTIIGYLSNKQGTAKVHGAPLGKAEGERVKKLMGRPDGEFVVEPEVYDYFKQQAGRGKAAREAWLKMFDRYREKYPDLAALFGRYTSAALPPSLWNDLPKNTDKALATRKASENALSVIFPALPNFFGGSADLTGSNLTRPASAKLTDFQPESPTGRVVHFGVREHAMAAIVNGIDAHGGLIPFGATFLNFIGYALGAIRLSALSRHGSIFVATHDSIGLGEDGPTHQPVELLSGLRATPNLLTFRPADQTETSASWLIALESRATPSILCLTRQALKPLKNASLEGVRSGGYTVVDPEGGKPQVVLIGTGSEVEICVTAAELLQASGVPARVVSMPCTTLFDAQSDEYRQRVLPRGVPVVSVEAYAALGWERYSHYHVGLKGWGASGPYKKLYEYFGLTPKNVADKATKLIAYFKKAGCAPGSYVAKL